MTQKSSPPTVSRALSSSTLFRILLLSSALAVFFAGLQNAEAAGGVAEMKALTGDAPYLGTGNQEQAPEYFGEAYMRNYYQNPQYDYYGSRYARNYHNSMPYRNYGGGGFGGGGLYLPMASYRPANGIQQPLIGAPMSPFGGGFYGGSGNDWV